MDHKNKEKLKKQNSSRITEHKKGLTVTKRKGTGENGREGKGGIRGGKKKEGIIIISRYNVGGRGKGRAVQHREKK